MIISRTPVRVSFFGGGTDYPDYFRRHSGATLAMTIDKYVYVTVHRRADCFPNKIQVHYSQIEAVDNLKELRIPIVREALRLLQIDVGVEIHLVSDLPARTGLGTSSATTVGLLRALHAFQGRHVSSRRIAEEAIHIEQAMVGDRVGCQDQCVCAYGGLNHLQFPQDSDFLINRVVLPPERIATLLSHLMLVYTRRQRSASDVLEDQAKSTISGSLDVPLATMKAQVQTAIEILSTMQPIERFGELLHDAWMMKRSLSAQVSSQSIDDTYNSARRAGAIGGKLLGAGGGGFLLLFVQPSRRADVTSALEGVIPVNFQLEQSGSEIVYSGAVQNEWCPS